MRQGDQVAAGEHVRIEAEPILRERPLEVDREEAVVRSRHDPDRHRRPCLEVAHRLEYRVGFGSLMRLAGRSHLRWDVVEEVDGRVELRAVAVAFGGGLARPQRSGVLPPRARCLAG